MRMIVSCHRLLSFPSFSSLFLLLSPGRKGRKEKRERFICLYTLQFPLRSLRLCESYIHIMHALFFPGYCDQAASRTVA